MLEKFTKGFMDRSATKLSEKINDYAERGNLTIESVNIICTNTDAPIVEAVVLFSRKNDEINKGE